MKILSQIWAADFECTTEVDYKRDGLVRCYLWHARSLTEDKEDLGYDVASFIEFCKRKDVKTVWFHNLKYDGSFILSYILNQGCEQTAKQNKGQFSYDHIVTDTGQWMQLKLMFGNHVVKINDSAKKFPGFSLQDIAEELGIEGKTYLDVEMERPVGYVVTDMEIERVKGDTRILACAMKDLYDRGMTSITMAGDAKACFEQ